VASIESQVFALENLRTRYRPTESLDAWGCVIQAMPLIWTWTPHESDKGLDLLRQAVAKDPAYARANSLLAWAYAARAHIGKSDVETAIETALGYARLAAEQDADDPWSHMAMGYVYMVSRRFDPAVASLEQAIARNPSFAFAHMILGSTLGYGNRTADAMRHIDIASRLSPRDYLEGATLSTTGLCHFMDGRYGKAVEFLRRAVQLRPNFGTAWRTLASSAGLAGDLETGRAALSETRRLQPNLSADWIMQHHPIVASEDRERYVDGLRRSGLTQ
jgi:tetratricopeptide (TPR) repeat protein